MPARKPARGRTGAGTDAGMDAAFALGGGRSVAGPPHGRDREVTVSRATYLDLIEADRANTDDDDTAAAARRRTTLSLGERVRVKTRKGHAMKRKPSHYRSGPKKGQFKPRHASEAPRRKSPKRPRRARAAAAEAPRRRRRKSGSRSAHAPRRAARRGRRAAPRRTAARTTIVVARDSSPRRRRRAGGRRHHLREAMRGSMGAIAILGGGIVLGIEFAQVLNRVVVTLPAGATLPTGIASSVDSVDKYNSLAVMARPSWTSVGLQVGIGLAVAIGGAFLPWNWAKALSFGVGLGMVGHGITQLATAYIVAPLFKKSTNWGTRLYGDEQAANDALYPPTTAPGGQMGDPPRRDQTALPAAQQERYPHPFASQMGAPGAASTAGTPPALAAAMAGLARDTGAYQPPAVNVDKPGGAPPVYTAPQAPQAPPTQQQQAPQAPPQQPPTQQQQAPQAPPQRPAHFGDPPDMPSSPHPLLSRRAHVTRFTPLSTRAA
jgi:hypothetical protein